MINRSTSNIEEASTKQTQLLFITQTYIRLYGRIETTFPYFVSIHFKPTLDYMV